jgi:hypothetical protein
MIGILTTWLVIDLALTRDSRAYLCYRSDQTCSSLAPAYRPINAAGGIRSRLDNQGTLFGRTCPENSGVGKGGENAALYELRKSLDPLQVSIYVLSELPASARADINNFLKQHIFTDI